jgi:hypothetical protein
VAQINVGAATEVAMKEKKARVEDALHACRAAVEEGIARTARRKASVSFLTEINGLTVTLLTKKRFWLRSDSKQFVRGELV